jgi:hypothetical protein
MTKQIQAKLIELRKWIPKSRIEQLLDETTDLYLRRPDLFEEYVLILCDEFKRKLQSKPLPLEDHL